MDGPLLLGKRPASFDVLLCSDTEPPASLGEWLVEQGKLSSQEDIFYLTIEARADLLAGRSSDWQKIIQDRRAERDRDAKINVPDTIQDWREVARGMDASSIVDSE